METVTIEPKTGNWLENILDQILTEKRRQGKTYVVDCYTPNEISYRDSDGYTMVHAIKKHRTGTYLIEFEEVEKHPKGVCRLNIYKTDVHKTPLENRIFHAVFENDNPLYAKAATAKYFMMAATTTITPELLAHIKEYANYAEINL